MKLNINIKIINNFIWRYNANLDNLVNNEFKETKEKISVLKSSVIEIINQLNNFNKILYSYYELYYNVISNLDIKKRNYSLLQKVVWKNIMIILLEG